MDSTAIRASVKTVEGKYLLEEVLRKQKNRKIQVIPKEPLKKTRFTNQF